MTKKTKLQLDRELFEKVLQRWYYIKDNPTIYTVQGTNCAFCEQYAYKREIRLAGNVCKGCPITEMTGEPDCTATPYYDVVKALRRNLNAHAFQTIYTRNEAAAMKAIKAEIRFLNDLYTRVLSRKANFEHHNNELPMTLKTQAPK